MPVLFVLSFRMLEDDLKLSSDEEENEQVNCLSHGQALDAFRGINVVSCSE